MWQRQQTLYVLIAAILVAVLSFNNAYTVASPEGLREVSYWQLQAPYFGILLGILAFGVLLALVTFKSLILQMRLSSLSGIIALGMQVWLAYMYFTFEGPVFSLTAILPLGVGVFCFLAARGCFQDQLMVESAMRIRERRKRNK